MNFIGITVIAALILISAPAIAATQDELRDALVGNTFQGDMGGAGYSSFFGEDGTYHDASTTGSY